MPSDGYNWFLILVAIIASVVLVLINVYILVNFQHPEDRNQAWFPKFVVVRAPNRSTLGASEIFAPPGSSPALVRTPFEPLTFPFPLTRATRSHRSWA